MARKTRQADTKVEELYQRLRAMALEKGPGAQLPTVRALCELLGTTRVTLREALTLLEAEQFIYTRDRQGIFVSPTIYHKAIHVIFSSNGFASPVSPVWGMLWMQLEQEAQARAALKNEICTFHLVKPTADPVYSIPPAIEAMLQTERVDGVLAIGFQSTGQGILHTAGFPCITFAGEGVCTIYLDAFEFARLAVEALLKQQCRKIGWWTYQFAAYPLENMREVQAFRQLLQHHQQPLYPQAIRTPHLPNPQVPPSFQEQGYLLAKEVFEGPADTWPDGVIIADDMMTDGALVAFDELGLCVGRDLQVVTHANAGSPILFGRTKHMTVIEYDSALIAKTLFSALDLLMAGQRPEDLHMTIPPRLLPRPCP